MPTFRYTAAGGAGAGTIDAPDRASALRSLVGRGITPTALDAARATHDDTPAAPRLEFGFRPGMSRTDFGALMRELATAVGAGLPIVTALKTIARQHKRRAHAAMLATLIEELEHGRSLADAARAAGRPFDDLTVSLIRAGEAAGRLPEVLAQCAELLERGIRLRRTILSATLYPAILLGLIIAAVAVLVTVIVPKILEPIKGQVETLPLPTRLVQGTAFFIGSYWWVMLGLIVLAVVIGRRAMRDPAVRLNVHGGLLHIPVLGRLLRDVATARLARTLGTLTAAGVPVLNALRIARSTLGNAAMERVIDDVASQVAGGKAIAERLEHTTLFPPLLVQIISLGERSGTLDQTLLQASDAFEERTNTSVKVLTTVLPPLMVVCLACMVGLIVLSILLPLLEFQEALLR